MPTSLHFLLNQGANSNICLAYLSKKILLVKNPFAEYVYIVQYTYCCSPLPGATKTVGESSTYILKSQI